jgi:pimeloyl-ACP methyl ester carboxylesterase
MTGLVEIGVGPPIVALGVSFAGSDAHRLLAARFRVVALEAEDDAATAAARFVADSGLEQVGFLGVGASASAEALLAASEAGERARSIVLASPGPPPADPRLLKTPKAVLIGTDDPAQPPDAVAAWRAALPGSHVVLIYEGGGDVAAIRPRAFAEAAGDFLERQGRFGFMTGSVAISPG